MKLDPKYAEFCIENDYSYSQIYQALNDYTEKERNLLKKCKIKEIIADTQCSYYQIEKFINGKSINLSAYFKLVKYARLMSAQLR